MTKLLLDRNQYVHPEHFDEMRMYKSSERYVPRKSHSIKISPNPLELMHMHVRVLFTHDEHLRLTAVNQWNGGIVPRFFLGHTMLGNVWRFRADLPERLVKELELLCREEAGNILLEPQTKDSYVRLLSAHAEIKQVWQGPAYYCTRAIPLPTPPVAITLANAQLLKGGLEDWLPDVPYWQPFMVATKNGQAVAVCASVRSIAEAHEAGVETLSAYRRKGHAASAVAGWANALLEQKIIPLYSTSWTNKASQAVAKKLGFSLYGTDFHIT
jgi:hypothetical protein